MKRKAEGASAGMWIRRTRARRTPPRATTTQNALLRGLGWLAANFRALIGACEGGIRTSAVFNDATEAPVNAPTLFVAAVGGDDGDPSSALLLSDDLLSDVLSFLDLKCLSCAGRTCRSARSFLLKRDELWGALLQSLYGDEVPRLLPGETRRDLYKCMRLTTQALWKLWERRDIADEDEDGPSFRLRCPTPVVLTSPAQDPASVRAELSEYCIYFDVRRGEDNSSVFAAALRPSPELIEDHESRFQILEDGNIFPTSPLPYPCTEKSTWAWLDETFDLVARVCIGRGGSILCLGGCCGSGNWSLGSGYVRESSSNPADPMGAVASVDFEGTDIPLLQLPREDMSAAMDGFEELPYQDDDATPPIDEVEFGFKLNLFLRLTPTTKARDEWSITSFAVGADLKLSHVGSWFHPRLQSDEALLCCLREAVAATARDASDYIRVDENQTS